MCGIKCEHFIRCRQYDSVLGKPEFCLKDGTERRRNYTGKWASGKRVSNGGRVCGEYSESGYGYWIFNNAGKHYVDPGTVEII